MIVGGREGIHLSLSLSFLDLMSAQEHRGGSAGLQPEGECHKAPGPLQLHCAFSKETWPMDET